MKIFIIHQLYMVESSSHVNKIRVTNYLHVQQIVNQQVKYKKKHNTTFYVVRVLYVGLLGSALWNSNGHPRVKCRIRSKPTVLRISKFANSWVKIWTKPTTHVPKIRGYPIQTRSIAIPSDMSSGITGYAEPRADGIGKRSQGQKVGVDQSGLPSEKCFCFWVDLHSRACYSIRNEICRSCCGASANASIGWKVVKQLQLQWIACISVPMEIARSGTEVATSGLTGSGTWLDHIWSVDGNIQSFNIPIPNLGKLGVSRLLPKSSWITSGTF
jgi:hypothetical protein